MDKQEKELEEILRMFDKAPSPSSENSIQNQAQQNNKQLRQIPQRQSCSQQTVHSSKQSSTKKPENRLISNFCHEKIYKKADLLRFQKNSVRKGLIVMLFFGIYSPPFPPSADTARTLPYPHSKQPFLPFSRPPNTFFN